MNFSKMELHRKGELIPLDAPRVYKMLRFFLNNPGTRHLAHRIAEMKYGATTIIQPRARLILTFSACGKSWKRTPPTRHTSARSTVRAINLRQVNQPKGYER